MKTKLEKQEQTATPATPVSAAPETDNSPASMKSLFQRSPNGLGPVRQLHLRRVLTRPMVTMAKLKSLVCEAQSEIYVMPLPNKSRKGGVSNAIVFDAREYVQTESGFAAGAEIIVACHAIMVRALKDAGFSVIIRSEDAEGEEIIESEEGKPLTGALLAFMSGDIEDGKRYRSISVAELEG